MVQVWTADHDQQASTRPPEAPHVTSGGQKRTGNKQAPQLQSIKKYAKERSKQDSRRPERTKQDALLFDKFTGYRMQGGLHPGQTAGDHVSWMLCFKR